MAAEFKASGEKDFISECLDLLDEVRRAAGCFFPSLLVKRVASLFAKISDTAMKAHVLLMCGTQRLYKS